MKKISIIVPCYNEEATLPLLYDALASVALSNAGYQWEFLFVDDGSKDKTVSLLRELRSRDERVCYVSFSRNFGKECALLAGFDYATGDCAIIMDADLQHPPTLIPKLIEKWEEGYDDVYAERLTRGKESLLRKALSMGYYRFLQKVSQIDVLPNVGDFRLLDRKCINSLRELREAGRYTKGMYCFIGYKKIGVAFETQDRVAGESKMSYKSLIRLAIQGLTSYTTAPLRIATFLGLVISVFAFIYMVYIIVDTMINSNPVAGYPTLMVTILFLGGIQLLSLGIIGEYLGKVFEEVKHRPVYIVQSYNGRPQ